MIILYSWLEIVPDNFLKSKLIWSNKPTNFFRDLNSQLVTSNKAHFRSLEWLV